MTRIPFDKPPTPPRTPPDTSAPAPRAARTKARPAELTKQAGKARLSMPLDLTRLKAERAEQKVTPRGPEKSWTPGRANENKVHLIGKFMGWLDDANGKPEQGAALLRALAEAATNQKKIDRLARNVVSDIEASFPPEQIGAVTDRIEKLQPLLTSFPQFYLACHDKLVGLGNPQIAPSQPSGEISYEKQCVQAMKGYLDTLKNSKDEETWDKSFEQLRAITRQVDSLMPVEVCSWIEAELDKCSQEDLISIYKGAEHLWDRNGEAEGNLAYHVSGFLLAELIPHYDNEPVPLDKEPVPLDKEPVPLDKEPVPLDKEPVPLDKEPVPLNKEPIALIATEDTRTTTSSRSKQRKHKLPGLDLPKLSLPTKLSSLPTKLSSLPTKLPSLPTKLPSLPTKLPSLPTPKMPKFKSPLGSPRSFASPRAPFSSEVRYSKAPSIEESGPPEFSLVFNRPAWNEQGEAATAKFIYQLIEGDPESIKKSYYDGLNSVAKIVTDITKIGDLDEFDLWIDKALAGKSMEELHKLSVNIYANFGVKGEIFNHFSHRLYLRLLRMPSPPGRAGEDLALAEKLILAIRNGEESARNLHDQLFGSLGTSSDNDRILIAKKFEALCAGPLDRLTQKQLAEFGVSLPQGSFVFSESLLHNAFMDALNKLPRLDRKAIEKELGW